MKPEIPNSQEEANQKELVRKIEGYLYSNLAEDNFKGIELVCHVTDSEKRDVFNKMAFDILEYFIFYVDKDSLESIDYALKAIKYRHYIRGEYSFLLLRRASETYDKLKTALREDPNNQNLKRFFLEVDKD